MNLSSSHPINGCGVTDYGVIICAFISEAGPLFLIVDVSIICSHPCLLLFLCQFSSTRICSECRCRASSIHLFNLLYSPFPLFLAFLILSIFLVASATTSEIIIEILISMLVLMRTKSGTWIIVFLESEFISVVAIILNVVTKFIIIIIPLGCVGNSSDKSQGKYWAHLFFLLYDQENRFLLNVLVIRIGSKLFWLASIYQ